MNSNSIVKKGNSKKFNLIFFVDSEKTYHFKFNYIILKILIIFFILVFVISVFSIIISISFYKQNLNYENYITSFKKNLVEYFLEKDPLKENRFNINVSESIKDDSEKIIITDVNISNPNQTKADVVERKKEDTKVEKVEEKAKSEVNIITNSSIRIENPKIIQDLNKSKITFSLSNINHSKLTISGSVCAVIVGVNSKNEQIFYKIPEKLVVNQNNIPFSCKEGEKVKFSRLRPTEFVLDKGKSEFLIKQVNVYFSHNGLNGIVLNSFDN